MAILAKYLYYPKLGKVANIANDFQSRSDIGKPFATIEFERSASSTNSVRFIFLTVYGTFYAGSDLTRYLFPIRYTTQLLLN